MTFLNPLYLIALAAAAIPIILHLLNLRKTRVIEFSTLAFLKELQRSRIRKLKVRQWILLALRTLLVIFVVLAFTRPALRSTLGFLPGTEARTSVVIVLDDSFSMFDSDNRGMLFKQAKEKARAVLDMLKPGDEAALVRLSAARRGEPRFTAALGALRAELEAAEPSYRHVNITDALAAASALFATSNNFNKELYIISDEQRTHFATAPGEAPTPRLFDGSLRVFVFPLGAARTDNAAVTAVSVENALLEKDKPVELTATVFNDQNAALSGALISVFLDGERVVQSSVDAAPGARAEVRFTVTPKKAGFVQGYVELEDDAIPEDNRRHFSLYVPANLRVLLGPTGGQDAAITRLALDPGTGEDAARPLVLHSADRAALLSANLENYDVVVLLGAGFASPAFTERLAGWVRSGGGAMLFPDATGTQETLIRTVLPALGLPAPAGMRGVPGANEVTATFKDVDYDHPLFRTVFTPSGDGRPPVVDGPEIRALLRLRAGNEAQQVIGTSGGDAFLLDTRSGAGRVLVFAVAPDLAWSSFPLKGLFVPLLHRGAFYLAARADAGGTRLIGESFDITLPPRGAGGSYDLAAPDGGAVKLAPKSLSAGLVFSLADLDAPGTYLLRRDGTPLRAVSMNIDPAESAMEKIGQKDRDMFYSRLGIERVTELGRTADVRQAITEARFGVELWKYMLGLALLCALLEMFIARDSRTAAAVTPV
ncbi:MAG: BatA domain-containing protein [Ignavibacteriae bacterium]|nr:BatA domain-containing protein [Ignavibacteriota bacterium]